MLERLELEAFLVLAEELHFGRTAERLHVTTGRISQTIKKLERQVGAPLFERTSRAVRLTELGQRLRADLRPAYEQIGAGLEQAVIAARGITGTLKVGFSALWSGDLVVTAADLFRVRYPDCEVHIQEVQLGDPLGPLRAGELDLQLTEFPIDEPDIAVGPVVFSEPRALMVPAAGGALPRQRRQGRLRRSRARRPLLCQAWRRLRALQRRAAHRVRPPLAQERREHPDPCVHPDHPRDPPKRAQRRLGQKAQEPDGRPKAATPGRTPGDPRSGIHDQLRLDRPVRPVRRVLSGTALHRPQAMQSRAVNLVTHDVFIVQLRDATTAPTTGNLCVNRVSQRTGVSSEHMHLDG